MVPPTEKDGIVGDQAHPQPAEERPGQPQRGTEENRKADPVGVGTDVLVEASNHLGTHPDAAKEAKRTGLDCPPAARRPNRARPRERRRRDGDAEERRHDRRPEDERNRRRPREDERRAQSRPRTQQTCATAGEKPQHEQNGAARERLAQRALIAGRAEQHQRTQDHREHRRNDREAGQPPLRCPASRRCYPLRRRERRQRGPRADLRVLHPPRDVGGKPAQAPREQRECQPRAWFGFARLLPQIGLDLVSATVAKLRAEPVGVEPDPAAREIRRPGCRYHGHEGCRPSRREPFAGARSACRTSAA